MTRTVRRKNSHEEEFYTSDYVFFEDMNVSTVIQKTGKRLAKAKSKFHSDRDLDWNAPAWFRRSINREDRRKVNKEMNNIMKKSSEYLYWYNFNPIKKTANWIWF